jgi:hypothetical protein
MKKAIILFLFTIFSICGMVNTSRADDAEVLPKGAFSARFNSLFYLPVEERYDPDGNIEDVAADYNTTLDSEIFPDLSLLEGPPFNLPSASIGDSVVSFEMEFVDLTLTFAYGVTDRLMVGIEIPYSFQANNVDARLDTTNATVGKNPSFGSPGDPFGGAPLVPINQGGIPLNEEDVQDLLGGGLDVDGDGGVDTPGLGYARFEDWSESGLLDIDVGAKYQYFKNDTWRLALTGGVRIPTGEADDPDDLVDLEFGTGAWALFLHSNNDFTAFENLLLNATARYYLFLPDRETLRVPDDVNQPVTANREKVDRDKGDVIDLELEARYEFFRGANISVLYNFTHAFKDEVSGNLGFNYKSLEDETEWESHIFIAGFSYSTVPLYLEKKFPAPFSIGLFYRTRFAGKNNALRTEFVKVALQAFF